MDGQTNKLTATLLIQILSYMQLIILLVSALLDVALLIQVLGCIAYYHYVGVKSFSFFNEPNTIRELKNQSQDIASFDIMCQKIYVILSNEDSPKFKQVWRNLSNRYTSLGSSMNTRIKELRKSLVEILRGVKEKSERILFTN